ncbi:MAG: helix-turn-helix domain-containing protein [Bryobacteraceae bacterium]
MARQAKFEAVPLSADRLDSWKDIAGYLKRSVRTVRRWEEQHGLPVYRVGDQAGASVFTYKSELDA